MRRETGSATLVQIFAAMIVVLLILLLVILVSGGAESDASPLKVYSHKANLYGGNLTVTRIYGNVTVSKPTTATVYVNGLGKYGDDGDRPQLWHVRLHKGRNLFRRTFFVRHWDFVTVPADHYVPSRVYRVFVGFTLGGVTAHG